MCRVFLASLASILLMTACVPSAAPSLRGEPPESADACSAIATATSVQVLLPPGTAPVGKGAYRLTDPDAVRRLVDFVNLRRNVSPPTADTPPGPKLKATFYSGTRRVAIFGSGSGVFYLQCGTVRGTRYASAAETAEFEMLTARPNADQ
jgi:hypothetical protein